MRSRNSSFKSVQPELIILTDSSSYEDWKVHFEALLAREGVSCLLDEESLWLKYKVKLTNNEDAKRPSDELRLKYREDCRIFKGYLHQSVSASVWRYLENRDEAPIEIMRILQGLYEESPLMRNRKAMDKLGRLRFTPGQSFEQHVDAFEYWLSQFETAGHQLSEERRVDMFVQSLDLHFPYTAAKMDDLDLEGPGQVTLANAIETAKREYFSLKINWENQNQDDTFRTDYMPTSNFYSPDLRRSGKLMHVASKHRLSSGTACSVCTVCKKPASQVRCPRRKSSH